MICLAIPGFQHLSWEVKQTFGLFINVKIKDLILPILSIIVTDKYKFMNK